MADPQKCTSYIFKMYSVYFDPNSLSLYRGGYGLPYENRPRFDFAGCNAPD